MRIPLSLSQKYICNLFNDYEKYLPKIKNKYLNICLKKTKNRYGEDNRDLTIVTWPDYKTKTKIKSSKIKSKIKYPKRKLLKSSSKKKSQKSCKCDEISRKKRTKRKIKLNRNKRIKRTKRTKKKTKDKLLYFYMDGCHYCVQFESLWQRLKEDNKNIKFMKINGPKNKKLSLKYNINSYPSLTFKGQVNDTIILFL